MLYGLALILEGLGLKFSRDISFYILAFLPFFLFIFGTKGRIVVPRNFTILSFAFLLILTLSFAFSLNLDQSFKFLLLYVSSFLIFIYIFNNKRRINKFLLPLIFTAAILFSLYSLLLFFIPETGYQFVFSSFSSHNHLGDFLILPLLSSLYFFMTGEKQVLFFLTSLLFIPYFIFSFSRSSYLAFAATAILMFLWLSKTRQIKSHFLSFLFLFFISSIAVLFVFITVKDVGTNTLAERAGRVLRDRHELKDKYFLAYRNKFFKEAALSIRERPLLGVGPGNFSYASAKYTELPSLWTESAHNIFLEVFVENGVFAGIVFMALIVLILKRLRKNLLFFLALSLLLNFQTDYTYRIYSFLALFVVILGLNYEAREVIKWRKSNFMFASISVFLALSALLMALSGAALKLDKPVLSFYLYPLNKNVYKPLIDASSLKKDREGEKFLLSPYGNFFRGDPEVLDYLGGVYEKKGDKALSLNYYEQAFEANPIRDWNIVWAVYNLKKQLLGEKEAKAFADRVFAKVEGVREKWSIDENFRIETMKLCQSLYNLHCPYDL